MKLFKKKDKDAKAKKKAKPEKGADDGGSSEGKKKKRAGGDGIATLFVNHIEKMLLGLAALFALVMIFKGFAARTAIEGNKAPQQLQSQAQQAVSKMNGYSWSDFRSSRDQDKQFLARSAATQQKVKLEDYAMGQLIKPPMIPAKTLRTDPVLLAAEDLRVVSGYGPMVTKGFAADGEKNPNAPIRDSDRRQWEEWINPMGDVTKGVYFNAVTAAIPIAEQRRLFAPLKNTDGYDKDRDQPKYLAWLLYREESIPGQPKPRQTKISIRNYNNSREQWGGSGDVTLDPPEKYMHPVLSGKVPPILLGDMPQYAVHPKIPLKEEVVAMAGQPEQEKPKAAEVDEWGTEIFSSQDRTEEKTEAIDETEKERPAEYFLFRYFDLDVKPGRSYRYSLMMLMDDPNRPSSSGSNAPKPETLDQTVAERLASSKRRGRTTPRSEPSNRVYVSTGSRIIAGDVTAATYASAEGGVFAAGEPEAQIMATTFKPENGASIPAVETVYRGSVANYAKDVWYWPPLGNRAERAENHLFKTNTTVLDIRGGKELANSGIDSPGELLVLDPQGRLSVASELEDADTFRSLWVPEPEVEKRPSRNDDDERGNRRRRREQPQRERGRQR